MPRTQSQLENALLEGYHAAVPGNAIAAEIRASARDTNVVAMLEGLDSHGLLKPVCATFTGAKLNAAGLTKFETLSHEILPSGFEGGWLAFLSVLTEKLNQRERAEVVKAFELTPEEAANLKKLDAQVTKLEAALKATKIHRPSHVWEVLNTAPADEVLLVLYRSGAKVVQDRIRAYHEKYLPLSQEVTDEQVIEAGGKPGTAKFEKVRRNLITALLNVRPKKIEPEPEPIPLVVASAGAIRSRNQPAP